MSQPVFLLPKENIMVTAKIEGHEVKIINDTIFPKQKKYAISDYGIAACLDKEKEIVIYGKINQNGNFDYYEIINFPEFIKPQAICIFDNFLVLGGINDKFEDEKEYEILMTYDIVHKKYNSIEFPIKSYKNSIEDFWIDGDIINVVCISAGKIEILEYAFLDNNQLKHCKTNDLSVRCLGNMIDLCIINEKFIAIQNSLMDHDGCSFFINIFKKGSYKEIISITKGFSIDEGVDRGINMDNGWSDMILIDNFLCISSGENGVGFLEIKNDDFNENGNVKNDEVLYINPWEKNIEKILKVSDDSNYYIIISVDEFNFLKYDLTTKEDIIEKYEYACNSDDDIQFDEFDRDDGDYPPSDFDEDYYERDYFDAMTDGQLGDYDDFRERGGNIDDLNDIVGK